MRAAQVVVVVSLVLVGVASLALAQAPAGSTLEANDPILLNGRTDAAYAAGIVSFVSSKAASAVSLTLSADEIAYNDTTYAPGSCPSAPVPGSSCTTTAPASQVATLRNAKVTLEGATSAYKVAISNNRSQAVPAASFGAPGSLVSITGASSILGANPQATHLSAYEGDWSTSTTRAPGAPFYLVEPNAASMSATGGSVSADKGLRVLLQGVKVHLTGTDASSGKAIDSVIDTASSGSSIHFLILDATAAQLSAQSEAPFVAYGLAIADVHEPGSAQLTHVSGQSMVNGQPVAYDSGSDITLPGPLSLGISGVKSGSPARITFTLSDKLRVLAPTPSGEPTSTRALVTAGAIGAGGAGLLAAALYFWPRLKFATTLLFLPLYSRIERTEVLEHTKRDELYELIRATPGIHAHEIGEKAHIGWGTTVYHLKLLETHGLVVSKKSGRYKRFFVNTGEYTKKKDVYGALRNETAKKVAQFVIDHPGANQKDLCAAVGIQPSLASWHVEKLEGVGLIKRVKDGRQVRYFAGPAWAELNVSLGAHGGADTPVET